MAQITWDAVGERYYETGVDHCVLYPIQATKATGSDSYYSKGVAWNGITGITESPSGAEANAIYADNIKYLNLMSAEEFGATIEAYTYPDEFAECDGSATLDSAGAVTIGQQTRKMFGLCYRTVKGNDQAGNEYGELIHLIYGCKASPSERGYTTINDSPDAITFSWEINTTPVDVANFKPTSRLIIDMSKVPAGAGKTALLNALYGTNGTGGSSGTDAYLPLPSEVVTLLATQG